MLRKILGVVLGYLTMAVFVFLTFTAAYLAMGQDNAFQPNSYDVSTLWLLISFILGLIGAMVGGFVSALIGKDTSTPKILAGIVLVLGLMLAVSVAMSEKSNEVRSGEVSNMEAMQKAQQPVWVAFLNPFVGAIGVLVGGNLRKRKDY